MQIGRFNKTAPARKAKKSQERCNANFPDMISYEEWPPYTPYLNSVDYSVWSILESRACTKPHKTSDSLKQSLLREWDRLKAVLLSSVQFLGHHFGEQADLGRGVYLNHGSTGLQLRRVCLRRLRGKDSLTSR
ncbi:uncharacterized protein TNCV_4003691 [Trichonephila clavipes]|nr:uncharacterized protein TNCV_4003691 [Trichonephila clavipes]